MIGLWVWAGCAWLRAERVEDPLVVPLQQADAAWRARSQGGLDPVREALAALNATAAGDARILWRLARLHWLEGFLATSEGDARNHWETGREYAGTCLTTDPDILAALRQNGWRIADGALATASPEQRPCILWGAGNGLALVELRGPGGALDAAAACAMTDRAAELVGADEPGLLDWEQGLCAWWLLEDGPVAMRHWTAAAQSGNALYLLAAQQYAADTPIPFVAKPGYELEADAARARAY